MWLVMPREDEGLADLLDLDGEEIIYDGGYVAQFTVKRVATTLERPHGVPHRGGRFVRRQSAFDHWHRDETDEGQPYRS
jgi:hypothetical protein